jgi:hypothetical protein
MDRSKPQRTLHVGMIGNEEKREAEGDVLDFT